uniref:Uncharacterized protein n=1 Tax=Nelumbo nucifera TaxID=4432 RepID=A0A822Z6I6_NELNU|nr:TPA_asm: hypothetical protein HUJ06_013614 [Nelumbo nucifera]
MKSIVLVSILVISVLFAPTEVGARPLVERSLLEKAVTPVTRIPNLPFCDKPGRPYKSCLSPRNQPPKCGSIYQCGPSAPRSP